MIAAFLITLREGLEAALIIGIVLSLLRRLEHSGRARLVWMGVAAAVVVSLVVGLALNSLGLAFEGRAEELFEGSAMLVAAGVLTWMIFWMRRQGRQAHSDLEVDVRRATYKGSTWALFVLAFVAVVREGIETALFLTAAAFSASPAEVLLGGILGLFGATLLGWLVFAGSKRLDIRAFFRVTSFLLILFAAGLVAHGVHELQEAAVLPTIIEHVWDVNHILDENSTVGSLLKALIGYNGNPSLIETLAYLMYFATILLISIPSRSERIRLPRRHSPSATPR